MRTSRCCHASFVARMTRVGTTRRRTPAGFPLRKLSTSTDEDKRVSVLPASLSSLGLKYLEEDALRERFEKYDVDGDGSINHSEALQLLKDAGVADADVTGAQKVVDSMDANNSGTVEWSEFKAAVNKAAEPVSTKVYPISGSLLLNFMGQGVQMPVLPILCRSAGLGATELGLVTGASAAARIASGIPAAMLAERVGRRPLVVAGPMVSAVGMSLFAVAGQVGDGLGLFVCANALAGLGGAITMSGAGLYLTDISTPLNRSRTMAPLYTTAMLGFAVGPALGGFLAQSYDLHTPFLVTAAGMAAASVTGAAMLPETQRRPTTATSSTAPAEPVWQQWRDLLGLPPIQGINVVMFMSGVAQGAGPVTTILFATEHLSMTPGTLGVMFTAQVLSMAAVFRPGALLSDRLKGRCRSVIMMPGLLVMAATYACQAVCTTVAPFVAFQILRALSDSALVMPNTTPFIIDNTNERQRAQALAMRTMSQDVGTLVGALSMGGLASMAGVPVAMFTMAGLQFATAAFFGLLNRHGLTLAGLTGRGKPK